MTPPQYPIPGRLNLFLALLVAVVCTVLLRASGLVQSWWALALLAVIYGLVMNTGYALCHEAEHDIFHHRPAGSGPTTEVGNHFIWK